MKTTRFLAWEHGIILIVAIILSLGAWYGGQKAEDPTYRELQMADAGDFEADGTLRMDRAPAWWTSWANPPRPPVQEVYFEVDGFTPINPFAARWIAGGLLHAWPEADALVVGRASRSEIDPEELSMLRALAVAKILADAGIPAHRVIVEWQGAEHAEAHDCRWDRRVELRVQR